MKVIHRSDNIKKQQKINSMYNDITRKIESLYHAFPRKKMVELRKMSHDTTRAINQLIQYQDGIIKEQNLLTIGKDIKNT